MSARTLAELNEPRYAGRVGTYEVWYVTVNDRRRGTGAWIRYTAYRPRFAAVLEPEAAVWAAVFDRGNPSRNRVAKQAFPLRALHNDPVRFCVRVEHSELTEDGCQGRFESDGGRWEWRLEFHPHAQPVRFVPPVIQALSSVFQDGPQPALLISGFVTAGDDRFEFNAANGSQQHTGGTSHALEWNWAHCAGLDGQPPAWFGGVTARVRSRGPLRLGGTVAGLETGGRRWLFNSPSTVLLGRRQASVQQWLAIARSRRYLLRATVHPRPQDLLGVRYDDPRGGTRFCYHTEVADLELELATTSPGGDQEVVFATRQESAAAFEYASSQEVPGIPVRV